MSRTRSQRTNADPALNGAHMLIGLLAILVAVGILVLSMRAQDGVPGTSHYDLSVQFGESRGAPVLPPRGSDVRIAGRRVGQTQQTRIERGVATLHMQLDTSVGQLPSDTHVQVRSQGVLGAKYVDVAPGKSATMLASGSVIAAGRTSIATTLSDVMQALDAEPRNGLRQMLRGLGGGLAGRGGALNEALDGIAPGIRDFSRTIGPIVSDRTLPGLVGAADAAAGAFDPVRDELAATFTPLERAVRPFAAERASVDRLLAVAPGALDGARRGLAGSDRLLARATSFADAATGFTKVAPRALDSITALLRDGRRPLGSARAVLLTAQAAVPPALELTRALNPVLPRLESVLDVARDPTRTLGAYGCDISRWGRTWRSMLGFAPRGQSGSLGPLTILRTTLAVGGGIPGVPNGTPGATVDGNITPCEPDRGRP